MDEIKPVAIRHSFDGYGWLYADGGSGSDWLARYSAQADSQPLYTRPAPAADPARKFALGDRVTKTKGSSWTGLVVGFYSTSLTPVGYAIESENEPGSVQIYPESALAAAYTEARKDGE